VLTETVRVERVSRQVAGCHQHRVTAVQKCTIWSQRYWYSRGKQLTMWHIASFMAAV